MRKHALLIGIDQYEDMGIQELRGAENDAHEMAFLLERTCQFEQVEMLRGREVCFSGVLSALEQLARGLHRDDLFVFYFSGHGYDHTQHGHLLLLHDTVHRTLASMPNEVLPVRSLKEYTTGFDCRKVVFMLDACRSPLDKNKSMDTVSLGATAERDIKLLASRSGLGQHDIQVLCSCSPGQQAFEIHKKRRGAFTLAFTGLVEQWAAKGREIALTDSFLGGVEQEMSRLLREHGLGDKHQRPWKEGSASPVVLLPGHARPPVAPPEVEEETPVAPLKPVRAPVRQEVAARADSTPGRTSLLWGVVLLVGIVALLAFPAFNRMTRTESRQTEVATTVQPPPPPPPPPSGDLAPGTQRTFAGIEMVWIPPGTFTMSSPDGEKGRYGNEGPQRQVTIREGFWLGKYPVTQAQWQAVMGSTPSDFEGAQNPVERVSWNDVQEYIQKLNGQGQGTFRLPTEAEWEYACRAGTTTRFYWGDDPNETQIKDYAWYSGNSGSKTHPVGQKRPNAWGLYDMSGNVWEWCADDWHGNYNGAPTDGRAWVDAPRGSYRVNRGGSWSSSPRICRSALRNWYTPVGRDYLLGFRLALPAVR